MFCCTGTDMAEQVCGLGSEGGDAVKDAPVDPAAWVRETQPGILHLDLLAPAIHCAACIGTIERALRAVPGVVNARVNLTSRRISLDWREGQADPKDLIGHILALGYRVQPFDADQMADALDDGEGRLLLRSMAVAGFAAGNVMLLSVSVWSGASDATRDLFHWISALIAMPAVAYAGRPFFRSAFAVLRHRRLNMDVPISLAVILAAGMSLYETMSSGQHAYFDASVTLLFFLLIGRYLDHRMRARARSAAAQLVALSATGATVMHEDGSRESLPISQIKEGMIVAVAAGERIPVDGEVITGMSDIDRSMVTGETMPEAVAQGARVHAGMLNLTGALFVGVTATGEDTLLAEIRRLMEAAEKGRARFTRLADRAAQIYAPAVHLVSAATFLGWLALGGGWHAALMNAIAVLIITCPCALGLAVPAVQVVASGILLRRGVMVKDGAGFEKLAGIDTVVFDKTGTLTLGRLRMAGEGRQDKDALAIAAGLARESTHPLSRALAAAANERAVDPVEIVDVTEIPGSGLEGFANGGRVRLGSRAWCGPGTADEEESEFTELWLKPDGKPAHCYRFSDEPRPDAFGTVAVLKARGLDIHLLSGDRQAVAAPLAASLGIENFRAECQPQDKVAYLQELAAGGRKVLMVGDGLNDAPALAAAHVSMSPATASEISQTSATFVFLGRNLDPVRATWELACKADRLVKQNFGLAILYNLVAVPVAALGFATPLVAAIAMSSSSIVVTLNALRLRLGEKLASPDGLLPAQPKPAQQSTAGLVEAGP